FFPLIPIQVPRNFISTAIPHKGGSSIPLPGSALPARRCPPDKVRPVAGSSRASSPAMSMIPRGPPAAPSNSPYQTNSVQQQQQQQKNNNSMLDKLKLFKSTDRPAPAPTNGKRTSSSSGVSSARSEKSDSSASLEPNVDLKPIRNSCRVKQQRPSTKTTVVKNSPIPGKKDVTVSKAAKTAQDVEKHAYKVANLNSKLAEPKAKVSGGNKRLECNDLSGKSPQLPPQNAMHAPNTGIPKPTAAIKGTSKAPREGSLKSPTVSREGSQASISTKPTIALVSPMKIENQLSESSHSASTGHHSNSSESSVIYKPSSESGSEHNVLVTNRKETLGYLEEVSELPPDNHQSTTKLEITSEKTNDENIDQNNELKPEENMKLKPDAFIPNFPHKDIYQNLQHDQLYHQSNNIYHHFHNYQNNISSSQLTPNEKNHAYQNKIIQEIYQEEKQLNTASHGEEDGINVEPMRPLLRGYCSTLTLPARPRHYPRVQPDGGADYCEISLVNGYLSDGEVLRNPAAREICDGYMSEGGAALYARRLQTMPAQMPNAENNSAIPEYNRQCG
ncbi:hypothetical protein AMK59_732, partial [Oryctes borbonicus]